MVRGGDLDVALMRCLMLRCCFALVVSSRRAPHAGLTRRFDADPIHGSLIDFKIFGLKRIKGLCGA
jgi:hypothetical protein